MVLKTFLLGAAILALTHKPQFVASETSWPCPEPAEVSPCVCDYVQPDLAIDMDCSAVKSDEDLQRAFQANFPFHKYRKLSIIGNQSPAKRVNITELNRETFQNVTFSHVEITYTNLESIALDTFFDSVLDLVAMQVTENFITTFPFDMLSDCPVLTDLILDHNNLTRMSLLRSTSLSVLQVSNNPLLMYEDNVFTEAPNLETLTMRNTGITHVAPGTFEEQLKLKQLDMGNNLLETLRMDALNFTKDPYLESILLDNNNIHDVEQNAFQGLAKDTALQLQNNNLTDLPQQVWEPVFQQVFKTDSDLLNFDDNPLTCECNILWLVSNTSYMNIISDGTTCQEGILLSEVDVNFLFQNCPTTSS